MTKTREEIQEVLDKWRNDEHPEPKTVLDFEEVLTWYYGKGGYIKADVDMARSLVKSSSSGSVLQKSPTYADAYSLSKEELAQEVTLDDVEEVLGLTVVMDRVSKLVSFLALISNYTYDGQQNIGFVSVSSSGKSYIAKQVVDLFPEEDVLKIQHQSPRSLFHDHGSLVEDTVDNKPGGPVLRLDAYVQTHIQKWLGENPQPEVGDGVTAWRERKKDETNRLKAEWGQMRKATLIDMHQKIFVFLDQPHWRLMDVLKPVLSHDEKVTRSSIVDKTKEGSHQTKTVFLRGFPSVVFLTVKTDLDEQVKNRMFLLSATVNQQKLTGSLDLISEKTASPDGFNDRVKSNKKKRNLMARIRMLKGKEILYIKFKRDDIKRTQKMFQEEHPVLKPRSMRDYPRLLALIKGHALLNWSNRTLRNQSIYVNDADIKAGLDLYREIAEANELGLEPELYNFAVDVLEPRLKEAEEEGITLVQFRTLWSEYSGGYLSDRMLARKLEMLEMVGLVERGKDEQDKRLTKLYAPQYGGRKITIDWLRVQQLQGAFTISQSDWDKYGAECERKGLIVGTVGSDFEMTEKGRHVLQEGES